MEPNLMPDAESIRTLTTVGGVAAIINALMAMAQRPMLSPFWKPLPWFVKPVVLVALAAASGAFIALAAGQALPAAVFSAVVGLFSAIAGPSWRPIWEEAKAEKAEEDAAEKEAAKAAKEAAKLAAKAAKEAKQ